MPKKADLMPKNLSVIRVAVAPEADARMEVIADSEGRTKQRQIGLFIEQIAKLHREHPEKLTELGLLSPLSLHKLAS